MTNQNNSSTPTTGSILIYNRKDLAKKDHEIHFQFNPNSLNFTKGASWKPANQKSGTQDEETTQNQLNAPELIFSGGTGMSFSLKDLIFDTTSTGNQDVRGYTNQLLRLTMMGSFNVDADSPPLVRFSWGSILTCYAVVSQVDVTYTLFTNAGVPVRAKATVACTQAYDEDAPAPAQNPTSMTAPRKTHVVQEGDRLDYLAFKEYGQAARWREIAEANNLDNPLDLSAGQILILPQH
jgi:nucleoid-associated protein YgaU